MVFVTNIASGVSKSFAQAIDDRIASACLRRFAVDGDMAGIPLSTILRRTLRCVPSGPCPSTGATCLCPFRRAIGYHVLTTRCVPIGATGVYTGGHRGHNPMSPNPKSPRTVSPAVPDSVSLPAPLRACAVSLPGPRHYKWMASSLVPILFKKLR